MNGMLAAYLNVPIPSTMFELSNGL